MRRWETKDRREEDMAGLVEIMLLWPLVTLVVEAGNATECEGRESALLFNINPRSTHWSNSGSLHKPLSRLKSSCRSLFF